MLLGGEAPSRRCRRLRGCALGASPTSRRRGDCLSRLEAAGSPAPPPPPSPLSTGRADGSPPATTSLGLITEEHRLIPHAFKNNVTLFGREDTWPGVHRLARIYGRHQRPAHRHLLQQCPCTEQQPVVKPQPDSQDKGLAFRQGTRLFVLYTVSSYMHSVGA